MKTMNYSDARANFAALLDGVENDREEAVITRAGHEPVVVLSLAEYQSLQETAYLLRSPANARRLLDSIAELERGGGEAHDLIDTTTAEPERREETVVDAIEIGFGN